MAFKDFMALRVLENMMADLQSNFLNVPTSNYVKQLLPSHGPLGRFFCLVIVLKAKQIDACVRLKDILKAMEVSVEACGSFQCLCVRPIRELLEVKPKGNRRYLR